jgi:hypothetical protein
MVVLFALGEPRGCVAWIVPEMVTAALREAVRGLAGRLVRMIRVMIAMTIRVRMVTSISYLGETI